MELKFILESILFSAQKPLSGKELKDVLTSAAEQDGEHDAKTFKKAKESEIISALFVALRLKCLISFRGL